MRRLALLLIAAWGVGGSSGCSPDQRAEVALAGVAGQAPATSGADRYRAVPYLGELEASLLFGEIWSRPELSERDRSLVTLAVTQARFNTEELREYLNRALDAGVTPEEISELMTHVTMYAGWPTGSNASRVVVDVYEARGIPFPAPVEPVSMEIDLRGQDPGYPGLPYLSALTRSVLFDETEGVWSRPGLSPRDRSMITVAVAQAAHASDQLRGHLGRALNNGLTAGEIAEVIAHVTLYAGWPTGVNAARIAGEVFEERGLSVAR
jgi:4-carboxymuconolactone decarboxylase